MSNQLETKVKDWAYGFWKIASIRWNQVRKKLESVVIAGMKDKSIKSEISPECASYILMNLLGGIRVTARITNDKDKMKKIVETTLQTFK